MLHKLSLPQKILAYSALVLLALVILFPIYYMILVSLKLPADIYREPSLLPINITLDNYSQLFTSANLYFLSGIRNSLIVASAATL
ncbi:MAG: carbohydrate ABC transporter permease, partial [Chloroflexi bacterium]|nr:carbohydrate ABC transporter permease [Chloroflexota bacterium]